MNACGIQSNPPRLMASKYAIVLLWVLFAAVAVQGRDLRLGMVGLDTGHVIAFTQLPHD